MNRLNFGNLYMKSEKRILKGLVPHHIGKNSYPNWKNLPIALFILWGLMFFLPNMAGAQAQIERQIYFFGNAGNLEMNDPIISAFQKQINEEKKATSFIFLGDILEKKDKRNEINPNQVFIESIQGLNNVKELHFLTGDRDWDNSGKRGKQHVKKLEKALKKQFDLKKLVIPSDGCPGPKTVALGEQTVLIAFNSQWLLHPYDRPAAPETDCKILTNADFWEELEEEIEDAEGKNIILAAHHPIYSNGHYAGKKFGYRYLIPFYGSFYTAYHQEIGNPADFANPKYQDFLFHLRSILSNHEGILYISGHEKGLEALYKDGNYYLNSGAFSEKKPIKQTDETLYKGKDKGWMRLTMYKNGRIGLSIYENKKNQFVETFNQILFKSSCDDNKGKIPVNERVSPCFKGIINVNKASFFVPDTLLTVVGGAEYDASNFKRFWMGDHYRAEWTAPIKVPYLDLDTEKGGLIPFAKGGGLQTHSLKFKGRDGQEYAFRSINKDPVKALSFFQKQTLYRHIVKDLITTQHPYGGLVAAHLLDETDILHAHPELFVMPDHPNLGEYRAAFKGKLGTLEIRPKGPKKVEIPFGDADDVVSSPKMFRSFYKNNKNRIDAKAYAKARVFDMWLGDWDRHEDNWKWAAYEDGKHTSYKPIPRDRDHVFSQWQGVIPSIADMVVPNAENFGYDFKNIQHLTFKARHLDRQLATELTREDWATAVNYIQEKMTDEVIDDALREFPDSIYALSAAEIGAKLKSRRKTLDKAGNGLYDLLAKEVDIVGSNKKEIFRVYRLPNGDVKVLMYDEKKGKSNVLLYNRTFLKKETEDIRLYGLDGADVFELAGEASTSILVRIIGGKGKDKIVDESKVDTEDSWTKVYDTKREDKIQFGWNTEILRPPHEAHYNNKSFEYGALTPIPKFRVSSGNGFGAELILTKTAQGFNKPDYARQHQLKLIWYSIRAQRLDFKSKFRHAVKDWDLVLHLRTSSYYDKNPFFYGYGNSTIRDSELFEEGYYRTNFSTIRFSPSLERNFLYKSKIRFGLTYEYNNVEADDDDESIFFEPLYQALDGLKRSHMGGIITELDLDFRDNPKFSTNGSQLYFEHRIYSNFTETGEFFGRLEGYASNYFSIKPLTFAVRLGGSQTYGQAPFYHSSALGSNKYLRAFFRNRFVGDRAAFLNLESRLSLGTLRTPLFPIKWGLFSFYDFGRVWVNDLPEVNTWHRGWGGGFYVAPLSEEFNVVFTFAKSSELFDKFYFSMNIGFDLQ